MDALLIHLGPALLVFLRLSGLFVFAPMLASTLVPMKTRVLLAVTLTVCVYPTIPVWQQAPVTLDVFTLGAAGFMEVLLGTVVGLLAMLPILSVQLAGVVMGQQMGIALAAVYNPALESESEPIGELLLYLALAVFIALGGLEMVVLATARTFEHVPLGGFESSWAPVGLVVGFIGAGFELALRITAPLMAILLAETVAAAFLAKTMPQLNILSIGFPIKVMMGLLAILIGLVAIHAAIGEHVAEAGRAILRWSGSLGSE